MDLRNDRVTNKNAISFFSPFMSIPISVALIQEVKKRERKREKSDACRKTIKEWIFYKPKRKWPEKHRSGKSFKKTGR